jgi:hypothetical protein
MRKQNKRNVKKNRKRLNARAKSTFRTPKVKQLKSWDDYEGETAKVNMLAYLHAKDGTYEITEGIAEGPTKVFNSKNALLEDICKKRWGHKAPFGSLVQYLFQTQSFSHYKQYPGMFGDNFIIHFYMKGADSEFPDSYSCRQCMTLSDEAYKQELKDAVSKAKSDGLDIKEYAA